MLCPTHGLDLFPFPDDDVQHQPIEQMDQILKIKSNEPELSTLQGRVEVAATTDSNNMLLVKRNRHSAPTYIFGFAQEPMITSTDGESELDNSPSSDRKIGSSSSHEWSSLNDETVGSKESPVISPDGSDVFLNLCLTPERGQNRSSTDDTSDGMSHPIESTCAQPSTGVQDGNGLLLISTAEQSELIGNINNGIEDVNGLILDTTIAANTGNELDLLCYENINVDELFADGPAMNVEPTTNEVDYEQIDFQVSIDELGKRGRCKRLRQSKLVTKCFWGISPENWRTGTETGGGIFINGVWNEVKGNGKNGKGQDKNDSKNKPSRFCHICLRRAERVAAVACARLVTTRCRKIVCKRCFDEYGWDWRKAIMGGCHWECSHCQQM